MAQTLMWLCDWSLEIERVQWLLEQVQVREVEELAGTPGQVDTRYWLKNTANTSMLQP